MHQMRMIAEHLGSGSWTWNEWRSPGRGGSAGILDGADDDPANRYPFARRDEAPGLDSRQAIKISMMRSMRLASLRIFEPNLVRTLGLESGSSQAFRNSRGP